MVFMTAEVVCVLLQYHIVSWCLRFCCFSLPGGGYIVCYRRSRVQPDSWTDSRKVYQQVNNTEGRLQPVLY